MHHKNESDLPVRAQAERTFSSFHPKDFGACLEPCGRHVNAWIVVGQWKQ